MEDDGTGDTRHETRYEKVTEYWRGWESKLLTLSEGIFIFWTTSTDVNNMRNCARHGYKFTMKWFYMNVFAWELLDYVLRWRKLWHDFIKGISESTWRISWSSGKQNI